MKYNKHHGDTLIFISFAYGFLIIYLEVGLSSLPLTLVAIACAGGNLHKAWKKEVGE